MTTRRRPIDVAYEADSKLPAFSGPQEAREAFFALMSRNRDRLKHLLETGNGPSFALDSEALAAIDRWRCALGTAQCTRIATTESELDYLVYWHAASVAVRHAPHAKWVVSESDLVAGRWQFGVNQGLATYMLPAAPIAIGRATRAPKRAIHHEWYCALCGRAASDPTLHPAVLANSSRLSNDPGVRHCQISVLSRGIDAFDEQALLQEMEDPDPPDLQGRPGRHRTKHRDDTRIAFLGSWQLQLTRCVEALPSIRSEMADYLLAIVENPSWQGRKFACAILLRQRESMGFDLLAKHPDLIGQYESGPLVDALYQSRDARAVPFLCRAAEQISLRNHSLWQEGVTFTKALRSLHDWEARGSAEASAAIRVARRRWRRIPDETLKLLRKQVPEFVIPKP